MDGRIIALSVYVGLAFAIPVVADMQNAARAQQPLIHGDTSGPDWNRAVEQNRQNQENQWNEALAYCRQNPGMCTFHNVPQQERQGR